MKKGDGRTVQIERKKRKENERKKKGKNEGDKEIGADERRVKKRKK